MVSSLRRGTWTFGPCLIQNPPLVRDTNRRFMSLFPGTARTHPFLRSLLHPSATLAPPFLPMQWGGGPAEARRAKAGGGAAAVRPRNVRDTLCRNAACGGAPSTRRFAPAHFPNLRWGGKAVAPALSTPGRGKSGHRFLPPLRGGSGFAKGKTEGGPSVSSAAPNPRRRPAAGASPARGGGNHSWLSSPLGARAILPGPHHRSRPGLVGRG